MIQLNYVVLWSRLSSIATQNWTSAAWMRHDTVQDKGAGRAATCPVLTCLNFVHRISFYIGVLASGKSFHPCLSVRDPRNINLSFSVFSFTSFVQRGHPFLVSLNWLFMMIKLGKIIRFFVQFHFTLVQRSVPYLFKKIWIDFSDLMAMKS